MALTLEQLMNRIIDELYAGLTGGTADLPLPQNMIINWVQPGLVFDESAFDWAIAGPFAGPTPLTLPYFRQLVETLMAGGGGGNGGQPMERAEAVETAKVMYQQNLLGGWEQWSRLVDHIPMVNPRPEDTTPTTKSGQGKYKHVSVVYGQANRTLSQVYQDTLTRCWAADEPLTSEQKQVVERMKRLLQEEVEVEDLLTGEKRKEFRESRVMTAYKEKQIAYENAVIDYAQKLARANNGTAADLIEWNRSGGIYKQRATQAMRDWIANGYKRDIETAQATINQILGTNMVSWLDKLRLDVEQIENNVSGAYGYSFFPAACLPGSFARLPGWSRFQNYKLDSTVKASGSTRDWGGSGGLNLGLFSIGASVSGHHQESHYSYDQEQFGLDFEYTQVEIVRPAFNPNFFLSRGWKPKDAFQLLYQTLVHSDGKEQPTGAMIGYPTKALFVKNLTIYSSSLASYMSQQQDSFSAGASFGWGPFSVGGRYSQSSHEFESNLKIEGSKLTMLGMQLVAFLSVLFPQTANPLPDVKQWI